VEGRVAVENKMARFTGNSVKHVDDVKEEEGMGRGFVKQKQYSTGATVKL
jgi:hypothetical protein